MAQAGQFIINHWGLWLGLIAILILIFINELMTQKSQAKKLSPQAAVALLNDDQAVVFDLRDADNFQKGHIINAKRVSADDFGQPKMSTYKDKAFILTCARGQQSAELATKLRSQGFNQVRVLAGGIAAWQAADLPLVKGK